MFTWTTFVVGEGVDGDRWLEQGGLAFAFPIIAGDTAGVTCGVRPFVGADHDHSRNPASGEGILDPVVGLDRGRRPGEAIRRFRWRYGGRSAGSARKINRSRQRGRARRAGA